MTLLLFAALDLDPPLAPAGLAAGRWPVAPWVIWIAGAGVVLVAILTLLLRLRAGRAPNARKSEEKRP